MTKSKKKPAAKEKPAIDIASTTTSYLDAVRIEIMITGGDATARDLIRKAINMAVESVTSEQRRELRR
jgi:hypothetical protein